MHGIRQNDVNNLHILVLTNAIEIFIIVDRIGGEIVLVREPLRLGCISADKRGQFRFFRNAKSGEQFFLREIAKSDHGKPDAFLLRKGFVRWCALRGL